MDLLQHMEEHERKLAELYQAYAELFPAQQTFWLDLAQEELVHALWLRNFAEKELDGQMHLKKVKINQSSIETSLGHINKQIDLAKERQVTLVAALAVARDLEDSLIDQLAMEILQTDNHRLKALMERIHLDSETHRNKINKEFLAHKQ